MTDDPNAALGARISEARQASGLDRDELAGSVGVAVETIANWEDGHRAPRANRLTTLCGVLGVSPAWLLSGDGVGPGDDAASLGPGRAEVKAELEAIRADLERATAALQRLTERLD